MPYPENETPHEATLRTVAERIEKDFDEALERQITGRLGPYWKREDIEARVMRCWYAEHPAEDWLLDGVVLLRAWPPVLETDGVSIGYSRRIELVNLWPEPEAKHQGPPLH